MQKKLSSKQRNEHTFGTPIDQSLNQDFDFEKNLALFDKEVCSFLLIVVHWTSSLK